MFVISRPVFVQGSMFDLLACPSKKSNTVHIGTEIVACSALEFIGMPAAQTSIGCMIVWIQRNKNSPARLSIPLSE